MNRLPSIFPLSASVTSPHQGLPAHASPTASTSSPVQRQHTSSTHYSTQTTRPAPHGPWDTREEAQAFMHYTRVLAPWLDICDKDKHFEIEVPERACHSPLLAASILAFAACQLALIDTNCESINPAKYNSRALNLLIPLLDEPMETLSEDVLASICLLRLVEEMEDNDLAAHLAGSSRLVNSSLAARGGLSEAASWIVLRQDMYICLTRRRPLSTDLKTFELSRAFVNPDPASLANRAIYLCAKVLEWGIGSAGPRKEADDACSKLLYQLHDWIKQVPPDYSILYAKKEPENQGEQSSTFPTIWMTHAAFIAGYQHIYLARMLIYMLHPNPDEMSERISMDYKASILRDLKLIVGLAMSNPGVINASFTACHALQSAGGWLESGRDQEAAVIFLQMIHKSTGWRTAHVIEELRSQWASSQHLDRGRNAWPLDHLV